MSNKKAICEDMLFNYETTYRTDYRDGQIKPIVKTEFKERPMCMRIRPPPLKDIHTLTGWKFPAPFNLMYTPKDIVGCDPRIVQKAYHPPSDPGRQHAQDTRPRLVMTPAVSMDDIADHDIRHILCEAMYTSDMTRATREAVSDYFSVRSPLPGPLAPANPIVLTKLREPVVPPELRMDSMKWDVDQLRSHCRPTEEFWLRRPLLKCKKCDETAVVTENRKMLRELRPKH